MSTSTSQPSARPIAPAPQPHPDTTRFLDLLFGEQTGWACLGYVNGDPSIKKGQAAYAPLKEEWFKWPAKRAAMLLRYAQLDVRGINTYVRMCLFSRKSGTQANALPSRVVWQDDVTDPNKVCSVLVQT